MKYCWRCKQNKPLNQFYSDKTRPDGYGQRCKPCDALYRREKRIRHPETYKEHDKRYQEIHYKRRRVFVEKWVKENPHKVKAHHFVRLALRRKELEKKPCETCGQIKVDAHHPDYSKPLDVKWLCRTHHMRLHEALPPL